MVILLHPWMRVVLSVLVGSIIIFYTTEGLTIYTAEGQRRHDVENYPRAVPEIIFVDQDDMPLTISTLKGKTVLMEFIFTSCSSFCYAMGSQYKKLQEKIIQSNNKSVVLISVSFDFENDTGEQIKNYANKFKAKKPYWYVVRAKSLVELQQLITAFDVIIVGDNQRGYEHDSAIHVINKNNKLNKIIDFNDEASINMIL